MHAQSDSVQNCWDYSWQRIKINDSTITVSDFRSTFEVLHINSWRAKSPALSYIVSSVWTKKQKRRKKQEFRISRTFVFEIPSLLWFDRDSERSGENCNYYWSKFIFVQVWFLLKMLEALFYMEKVWLTFLITFLFIFYQWAQLTDRPFRNFVASKSVARRCRNWSNSTISWSRGSKKPVG